MGLDQVFQGHHQHNNSSKMRRDQQPQQKKCFGDHGHEVSSNSVFIQSGSSVKSVSTAHQRLRKILELISRSRHGYGHSQLMQECPQNNVGLLEEGRGRGMGRGRRSVFEFLSSKHEENEKKRIGQKLELNLNCAPEPQSCEKEDGHGLKLGLPLGLEPQASEASHSNFYLCSNTPIQHERGNVDGDDLDKKKWWETGGGQWHPSNNNNTNNNSCVESENVSVLQRSSEGEYDPKIDVNFPASESVAVAIDLNNLAEGGEKEGSIEIQCDSKYEHKQGSEVEVEAEAEKYGGECSHESEVERDCSSQCRQERYGGLDLLVEAISLANGDLDVFDKEKKKKKRDNKQQDGKTKRRKGAPIDRATQDRPSVSTGWPEKEEEEEENFVEDYETKRAEVGILDWYDTAPLVRSKRGRNQALPSRFRDSVIEPWKRMSRPRLKTLTRQNSS